MVELHFHDSDFTLFGRSYSDEAPEDETYSTGTERNTSSSGGSGKRKLAAVVALAVLVGIAVAVRRKRSGGETTTPPAFEDEPTTPDA